MFKPKLNDSEKNSFFYSDLDTTNLSFISGMAKLRPALGPFLVSYRPIFDQFFH
jgi:hypothetical protein